MAELSDTNDKDGRSPEISHTFVIEIDRKGSQAQERLRWKWPQDQTSIKNIPPPSSGVGVKGDTNVAQELLNFLDTHLLAHEPGRLDVTADSSSRVLADQYPRGYSVEVHHPALGGWSPLSTETPSKTIPKNCRVHVSVNEKLKAVLPQQQGKIVSSPSASGGFGSAQPSLPPGQASIETEDGGKMLALPWRRFDQDLGGGGGEGFQICGRRMMVGDVSNSSEGTGLFTWDGSVLLAKYLEYRAVAMRRDFDSQRPRRQSRPMSTVINATGFTANSSCKKTPPVVRVLELGCGTGLAGLAAAFSFGRRKSGDSGTRSRAALTGSHHRHSNTGEGEKYGLDGCASSPTVEYSVEVVLTDLEYALENARANVHRNASSLKAVGSTVKAMELDWCRPLPDVFIGGDSFDLILAADVVWLDELVEPLVRTLERLTAGWPSYGGGNGSVQEERNSPQTRPAALSASSIAAQERGHGPRVRPRVLLAYQWRSQRTGNALLEELEKNFHVREIQPEECHPEYLPSSNLCLLEVVRR